ncbi:MAG: glycosyltransferase family 9 protein, partial [Pseudomonadota bacterium]
VIVTGGGSALEKQYADEITSNLDDVVDLVGKTTLKELAALIDRADAVICPDSGPAHIATAVNTPVIGLYATSNPGRTGPSQRADWIVNQYPQACRQYLSKTVDDLRWGQRVRHPDAMKLITVDAVVEKLDQLFGSR